MGVLLRFVRQGLRASLRHRFKLPAVPAALFCRRIPPQKGSQDIDPVCSLDTCLCLSLGRTRDKSEKSASELQLCCGTSVVRIYADRNISYHAASFPMGREGKQKGASGVSWDMFRHLSHSFHKGSRIDSNTYNIWTYRHS